MRPDAFIRANTQLLAPPHTPEIRLHLATELVPIWQKTEEELAAIGVPPPFWAFAWAGGQALARYLLDHPDTVQGKRVLDFASGSGLSAIAAAKAGARDVLATEIDPFAIAAIGLNATANGVAIASTLEDVICRDDGWDTVLAGDVCYEREMAARVFTWLRSLAGRSWVIRGATIFRRATSSKLPPMTCRPRASLKTARCDARKSGKFSPEGNSGRRPL